jgi:large subunit ribosomal protein L30
MKEIKLRLLHSHIGKSEKQRNVLLSLGLKRPNSIAVHIDTPSIRGMINKVPHLIEVSDI